MPTPPDPAELSRPPPRTPSATGRHRRFAPRLPRAELPPLWPTRVLLRRQGSSPGHGPYWLLTWSVDGKTRSRSIPAAQVAATKAQIAECQRLRRLVADLIAVSDDLCQARLKPGTSAVKKKVCQQAFAPALEAEIARLVAPEGDRPTRLRGGRGTCVRRQALQLAAKAVERRLNADRSDAQAKQPALLLRSCGALGGSPSEDLRDRLGARHPRACLLPLPALRQGLVSARPGAGHGLAPACLRASPA